MSLQRADVLIAGASFAGLAAARALGSHALLIDRAPLGAGVTSACGAPMAIVDRMGAATSIRQRHDHLVIDVEGHSVAWPLPEPFCTFDYGEFCRYAFEGSGARFQQASVQWIDGDRVSTTAGTFVAAMIIDATGPRSRLTTAPQKRWLAFGIETEIPAPPAAGLFFYFLPEVRDGYAWAFPCGPVTRFGVLSYRGKTKLRPALEAFVRRFGLAPGAIHGGYLATGWQSPVAGHVFVAGDAAGQCLPLTGEGIRTAVLAGERLGLLLRSVREGILSQGAAAAGYWSFVSRERRRYRALLWGTGAALALPRPILRLGARALSRPHPLAWFMQRYLSIFSFRPADQPL